MTKPTTWKRLTLPPWQAILLDLDDTLYPEREYVLSGFQAVARWADENLGIPSAEGYAQLSDLHEQGIRSDTFNRWLAARGIPGGDWVLKLVDVYRHHSPNVAPFPEIPSLLERLGRCCKLGLISDGYLGVQRKKLDALGLEQHFAAVVFSDEWGRESWKPSTRPFKEALATLEVDSSDAAVYVGDNAAKDFLGARRLGMRTIQCLWSGGDYIAIEPPTPEHAPDATASTISELKGMLLSDHTSIAAQGEQQ